MAKNLACLLVMAIMVMMQAGHGALAARDTKYCKSCARTLQCPDSCPSFNQGSSKSLCHIDCNTCTTQCKKSTDTCNAIGAVCQDPRFIGGDGILFYFHGKSNEDFCIVSDTNLHINGHFIGKPAEGRSRDFTWVQAIGILYGSHRVRVGAKKVATWDADVDQIEVSHDGNAVSLATLIGESWESPLRDFTVVRTRDVNSVEIQVHNLMKASINVTYVDEEDSKIHNYGINSSEDCFAHLDLLFTFFNLSSQVDGVLGQTYKQTYKSPLKVGVPMPTMGGYHNFKSSSLFASDCQVGVFDPSSFSQAPLRGVDTLASIPSTSCTSQGESGIVCRR